MRAVVGARYGTDSATRAGIAGAPAATQTRGPDPRRAGIRILARPSGRRSSARRNPEVRSRASTSRSSAVSFWTRRRSLRTCRWSSGSVRSACAYQKVDPRPIGTCRPVTFVLPSADADGLAHVVRACVEGRLRVRGSRPSVRVRRRAVVTAAKHCLAFGTRRAGGTTGVQAARRAYR
jgi:hypothetical protein